MRDLLIHIFPGSVCLFCCREICGPILGMYKSLTDTWMWKLGLRLRISQKRNTFSLQMLVVAESYQNYHNEAVNNQMTNVGIKIQNTNIGRNLVSSLLLSDSASNIRWSSLYQPLKWSDEKAALLNPGSPLKTEPIVCLIAALFRCQTVIFL